MTARPYPARVTSKQPLPHDGPTLDLAHAVDAVAVDHAAAAGRDRAPEPEQVTRYDADVELRRLLSRFYADTWAMARDQMNPRRTDV